MTKKGQAIRPDFISQIPSIVKQTEKVDQSGATEEEQALYALSQFKGWKILEEYVTTLLGEMDAGVVNSIQNGAGFDEIGRNTIVVTMAKEIIQKGILNRVADAIEACERENE